MLILNAGIPRSGTVLTNAMIRRILDLHDIRFEALNVNHREQVNLLSSIHQNGLVRWRTTLIHTHYWDAPTFDICKRMAPYVIVMGNMRDPRDVCVSTSKLLDQPISYTVKVIEQRVQFFEKMVKDTQITPFRYEEFIGDPVAFAHQIAKRLGLRITDAQASQIADETSIKSHKKVMKEIQASTDVSRINATKNRHRILKEDKDSHITDRHIQSAKTGRWKTELSAGDQTIVQDHLGETAKRLGYE